MIEIEIKDRTGHTYGEGPITTASRWQSTTILDGAGAVSFVMPAADPRAAHVQRRRYAACYGIVNNHRTLMGEMLITHTRLQPQPYGPTLLIVSGMDLLTELADRTVADTSVFQDDIHHPAYAMTGLISFVDLTRTLDDNDATVEYFAMVPNDGFLYIGDNTPFDFVRFRLAGLNDSGQDWNAEYWNGEEWHHLTFADQTAQDGLTFRHSGDFVLTTPADWVKTNVNGHFTYWARFAAAHRTIFAYVREIHVVRRLATTDALTMIMAHAPADWSLDLSRGHGRTSRETQIAFAGESVLAALVKISERTGDHFRHGAGRTLIWMWPDDLTDSGLRAVNADEPATDPDICTFADLEETRDIEDVFTRLYPHGGDGLTLLHTTRSAANLPTGWTFNRAANYIENTPAVAQIGIVERWTTTRDIAPAGAGLAREQAAANALFDAAVATLQLHAAEIKTYDVTVIALTGDLTLGQTIHLIYHEWRDDYHAVAIDATVYVLSMTTIMDLLGIRITALELSTTPRSLPGLTAPNLVMHLAEQLQYLTTVNGATNNTVSQQLAAQEAIIASLLEVRDRSNRPIFRVNHDDEFIAIGPSTHPGWRYDGATHTATPDSLEVRGPSGFNGAPAQPRPTITGSTDHNEALTSLLTALAAIGLIEDTTTT